MVTIAKLRKHFNPLGKKSWVPTKGKGVKLDDFSDYFPNKKCNNLFKL